MPKWARKVDACSSAESALDRSWLTIRLVVWLTANLPSLKIWLSWACPDCTPARIRVSMALELCEGVRVCVCVCGGGGGGQARLTSAHSLTEDEAYKVHNRYSVQRVDDNKKERQHS